MVYVVLYWYSLKALLLVPLVLCCHVLQRGLQTAGTSSGYEPWIEWESPCLAGINNFFRTNCMHYIPARLLVGIPVTHLSPVNRAV